MESLNEVMNLDLPKVDECKNSDNPQCNKMHNDLRAKFNPENKDPLKESLDIKTTSFYNKETDPLLFNQLIELNNLIKDSISKENSYIKFKKVNYENYGKILNFANTEAITLLIGFLNNYKSVYQYINILISYDKKIDLLRFIETNMMMLNDLLNLYTSFLKYTTKYFLDMLSFLGKRTYNSTKLTEKFAFVMDIALDKSNQGQFNQFEYGLVNICFKCLFNYNLIKRFIRSIKADIKSIDVSEAPRYNIEYYYSEFLEKLNSYGSKEEAIPYINYLNGRNKTYQVNFLNIFVDTSLKNIDIYLKNLYNEKTLKLS
jgi:hypothetical protein